MKLRNKVLAICVAVITMATVAMDSLTGEPDDETATITQAQTVLANA